MNVFCRFAMTTELVVDSSVDSNSESTVMEFIDSICPPPSVIANHAFHHYFQWGYKGKAESEYAFVY
jgi:hypothetical protein